MAKRKGELSYGLKSAICIGYILLNIVDLANTGNASQWCILIIYCTFCLTVFFLLSKVLSDDNLLFEDDVISVEPVVCFYTCNVSHTNPLCLVYLTQPSLYWSEQASSPRIILQDLQN